ncbi:I78 family peptidase inhibitor [Caenispirillum bisanense]|uniref:I78 family peptidase inhibitor n=1 Tax=Caenispirillum bisanense TaxID=414052 RepID=UPI0031E30551
MRLTPLPAAVAAVALLPLLAACAPPPGSAGQDARTPVAAPPAEPPPAPGDLAACNGEALAGAVGRFLVHGTAGPDEINQDTLPQPHRVLKPGMAYTMDFRPDRLNVEVDGTGRILSVRCG